MNFPNLGPPWCMPKAQNDEDFMDFERKGTIYSS